MASDSTTFRPPRDYLKNRATLNDVASQIANFDSLATDPAVSNGKTLVDRVAGRFYTHELIGRHLVRSILDQFTIFEKSEIRIAEPFCGDGRLVGWFLEEVKNCKAETIGSKRFSIELWDTDQDAVERAKKEIRAKANELQLDVRISTRAGDSFANIAKNENKFDIVLTNPPWENLKPDRRELAGLSKAEADDYKTALKRRDSWFADEFPLSQPEKKFSGWGTNLSRCGLEASYRITKTNGICGIVIPVSLLADQTSTRLRIWMYQNNCVKDLAYFVAEARLFENVDQPCATVTAVRNESTERPPKISSYDKHHLSKRHRLKVSDWKHVKDAAYVIPLQFGPELVAVTARLNKFSKFKDLETKADDGMWAGREIDETGYRKYLSDKGEFFFIKGRMIKRYGIADEPTEYVSTDGPAVPPSANHYRLAWRDVSRPSQKRRIHATIIPPGWAAGNSLHVAYFRNDDLESLHALLAIMNSFVFEWLTRSSLATSHVSLGAVRKSPLPPLGKKNKLNLARLAKSSLLGNLQSINQIDVFVAKLYRITKKEFASVLACYKKLSQEERTALLESWDDIVEPTHEANTFADPKVKIPNHYASTLSDLDMRMVKSVPVGGNWKDIPKTIPSKRLEQIRESYARGEGSRSTYYGRLRPEAPSYTISTYFPRPGNGCHIHYDQDRTLSQREAARLQSFPDSFAFVGNKTQVNKQIGNAVPPLLAFQIAKSISKRGIFVDLFCGAGGFGYGFKSAGWKPILGSDLESVFVKTYVSNVHKIGIPGDMQDEHFLNELVAKCLEARKKHSNKPLVVLGGPPCQGFSTAGNRRTMDDDRNWLFRAYKTFLQKIKPDAFIFENVPGILSMKAGTVFDMICEDLTNAIPGTVIKHWKLQAEQFGIPQRRKRVFLVGTVNKKLKISKPPNLTGESQESLFGCLPNWIGVHTALSDLPGLKPGVDGANLNYAAKASNPYQKLMRSEISVSEYLDLLGQ